MARRVPAWMRKRGQGKGWRWTASYQYLSVPAKMDILVQISQAPRDSVQPESAVPAANSPRRSSGQGFLLGAVLLIAQNLLLNVLSIPATAFIIRQLGPLGYGQWATAMGLVAITQFLANPGLRDIFVLRVSRDPASAEPELAQQLGVRLALGLLAGALSVGICLLLRHPWPVLVCVLINVANMMVVCAVQTLTDLLQALQRVKDYALGGLYAGVALTLISVAVVAAHGGPEAVTLAYASGPLINLAFVMVVLRRLRIGVRIGNPSGKLFKTVHEARFIGFQQFVSAVKERLETVMIPSIIGITAFGQYSAGALPAGRLMAIPESLCGTFYPRLIRLKETDENAAAHGVAQLILLVLVLCVPAAILVSFVSPTLAALLFPRVPAVCRDVMAISIWSLPLLGLASCLGYSLHAAGKYNEASAVGIRSSILGLALTAFCILKWGLLGCAWATVARGFLSGVLIAPLFLRTFPTAIGLVPVSRLALSALMILLVLGLGRWLSFDGPLELIGVAAVAGLVYLATVFALRIITPSQLRSLTNR